MCLLDFSEDTAASALPVAGWQHLADRLIDAALHADYTSALLLVTLASLGALVVALWILMKIVGMLTPRHRSPKPPTRHNWGRRR